MADINFEVVGLTEQIPYEGGVVPAHVHDDLYYRKGVVDSKDALKLNANQGVSNAGKILKTDETGSIECVYGFDSVSTLTRWNVIRPNQTETPIVTLPEVEAGQPQEILYVFTAMTQSALFQAPEGYVLFDEEKPMSTATGSIQFTDLTVGSMYECDFLVVGGNKISLLKIEHAEV